MTEEKLIISKRQGDKSLYRDPFARFISVSVVAFIQMTDLCQPGWEQAESEIVLLVFQIWATRARYKKHPVVQLY